MLQTSLWLGAGEFARVFFGKVFTAGASAPAVAAIAAGVEGGLRGRRVVIIDHPPTEGLLPLIVGLEAHGAEVILRDHHADSDRNGSAVAEIRAHLGARGVVKTRDEAPACAGLITAGEFAGDIVVADADQDGLTAALKALGVTYPKLDEDAAVLDGPVSGKTAERLSQIGYGLVRAWGALPPPGTPNWEKTFADIATAFSRVVAAEAWVTAASPHEHHDSEGGVHNDLADAEWARDEAAKALNAFAEEYERKVEVAKTLAKRSALIAPGVRVVDARGAAAYDQPTLAGELERGAVVTVLIKGDGPIAARSGAQVSLARTKAGEAAGIDLAALVPADWARGPAEGVISNTPFLLHLSPARWEEFRPILLAAVTG